MPEASFRIKPWIYFLECNNTSFLHCMGVVGWCDGAG